MAHLVPKKSTGASVEVCLFFFFFKNCELLLNLRKLKVAQQALFTSACYWELRRSISSGARRVGEISVRETVM